MRRSTVPFPHCARLAALAAVVLAVASAGSTAAAGASTASALDSATRSLWSKALQRRIEYLVALPPGYATSRARYPIVYFLHGLPAGPTGYHALGWVVQALAATGRRAILVVPQGSTASGSDPEYHDWGAGRNWETALAAELRSSVDARYRTIRSRAGRAIVGVSAGGYGATIIGLHHPAEYSVVESWSGYFRPTDPTGETTLDVGSNSENDDASVHMLTPRLKSQFRRWPTFLAFYVGNQDPVFVPDNTRLDRELTSAGVTHTFALYSGAHTSALWQAHAVGWLALALDHLADPRA